MSASVRLRLSNLDTTIENIIKLNKAYEVFQVEIQTVNEFYKKANFWIQDGLENMKLTTNLPLIKYLERIIITLNYDITKQIVLDSKILKCLCNKNVLDLKFGEIFLFHSELNIDFYFKKNSTNLDLKLFANQIYLDNPERAFIYNRFYSTNDIHYLFENKPFINKNKNINISISIYQYINILKNVKDSIVYLTNLFVVVEKGCKEISVSLNHTEQPYSRDYIFVKKINKNLELYKIKYYYLRLDSYDTALIIRDPKIKKVYIQGIVIRQNVFDTYQIF